MQALSAQKAAAAAPDAETAPVQEAELEVAALPESQPEYKQAVAYIEESAGEDGVLMVSALRFDFYYQASRWMFRPVRSRPKSARPRR